jgi:ankyrin repeat protein
MGVFLAKQNEMQQEDDDARSRARDYLNQTGNRPDYITEDNYHLFNLDVAPEEAEDDESLYDDEEEEEDADEDAEEGDPNEQQAMDDRGRAAAIVLEEHNQMLEAAKKGSYWKFRYLTGKAHIKLDYCDEHGRTATYFASERGHAKILKQLIYLGATVDVKTKWGWTPLLASVFHGHVKAMDDLFAANASVLTKDNNGMTAFHLVASSPKLYLIDFVPRGERKSRRQARRAAFRAQLDRNSLGKGLGMKVDERMDPNKNRGYGRMTAVYQKNKEDDEGNPINFWKYFPNRMELIVLDRLLQQPRIQIDARDNKLRTPLMLAARHGHDMTVSRLLAQMARVDTADKEGHTPLFHAVTTEQMRCVEMLLTMGSTVNHSDNLFNTPLHVAIGNKNEALTEMLIIAKADVNAFNAKGQTPIMLAMDAGSAKMFTVIIEQEPSLDCLDHRGWNVLIYAVEYNMLKEMVPMLNKLGKDAIPILQWQDPQGRTALHHAVINCNREFSLILKQIDHTVTIQDCNGNSPLHLTCEVGDLPILKMLLEDCDDSDQRNNKGQTPAMVAASNGNLSCFIRLFNSKDLSPAKSDLIDNLGWTVLMHACSSGHLDMVNLILQNKEGGNRTIALLKVEVNQQTNDGLTALMIAAREGHWALIASLVLAGANTAAKDRDGYTPLHWAALEGEAAVSSCLVQLKADPDAQDREGWTPLMHAATSGCDDVAQLLVDVDADLNKKNFGGLTALDVSLQGGHNLAAEILLDGLRDREILLGLPKMKKDVPCVGHFMVSVEEASDLQLEGVGDSVNPYCYIQMGTNKDSGTAGCFSTCVLHETYPQWHEAFRFDSENLDPSACLVIWVLTAPGTTQQEVIDSSTLGMSADEVQARARELTLLGKAGKSKKAAGYGDSMQGIFDNLMVKAQKVQKLEDQKKVDTEANAILKMGVKDVANSLQARRWLQVQNLQRSLGTQVNIPKPPVPPSHVPLGVVLVRFRQLREAVWSSEPLLLDRTLRLNSRGRLRLQIDFRPKFQQVPDHAREQPVRPFHTPRKEEMKESELQIGDPYAKPKPKQETSKALSATGESLSGDPSLLHPDEHHPEHVKSMGKTFFEVQKWSQTANLVGDAYEEAEMDAGIRKGGIADSSAAKFVRRGIRSVQKNFERRRLYDTQIRAQNQDEEDEGPQFFGEKPKFIAPSIRMDTRTLSRIEDSKLY